MKDCKSAGIVAVGLLATASLLAFVIHLLSGLNAGFLFALLPGAWLTVILGMRASLIPGPIALLLFVLLVSYCWYFVLSYCAIKIWRAMYPPIPERP